MFWAGVVCGVIIGFGFGALCVAILCLADPEDKQMDKVRSGEVITDGFGNYWSPWCYRCGDKTMRVVRPGKVQCGNCD